MINNEFYGGHEWVKHISSFLIYSVTRKDEIQINTMFELQCLSFFS